MVTETLNIEGMHCGHCSAMVEKSLSMVDGVSYADVTVGSATVVYDESKTDKAEIEAAVTRFGYKIMG